MKAELDESFAGLELRVHNHNGYIGDEGSSRNFDRITNTGTDVGRSQRAPAMISPTSTSKFGNSRICELVCLFLSKSKLSD